MCRQADGRCGPTPDALTRLFVDPSCPGQWPCGANSFAPESRPLRARERVRCGREASGRCRLASSRETDPPPPPPGPGRTRARGAGSTAARRWRTPLRVGPVHPSGAYQAVAGAFRRPDAGARCVWSAGMKVLCPWAGRKVRPTPSPAVPGHAESPPRGRLRCDGTVPPRRGALPSDGRQSSNGRWTGGRPADTPGPGDAARPAAGLAGVPGAPAA